MPIDIQKSWKLGSLRYPVEKVLSKTSCKSEDNLSIVSLSFKKLKHFINNSYNKKNKNNVPITG